MTDLSLTDAREAKQEGRGPDRNNDAGITDEYAIDYEKHSPIEVNLKPNVMVVFDHIARVSINTYGFDNILSMEQNLQGAGKFGFDIALTLAKPQIIGGDLWAPEGVEDEDFPTYLIAQDPESSENPYELDEDIVYDENDDPTGTEPSGIKQLPGGNTFDGQPVEDVPEYIEVSIGSSRAMDILGVLDTAGMWFSSQDGEVREGLFETPPNFGTDLYDSDEDGYPRLTGYPSLRSDMVGQRGAITSEFVDDGEENTTRTGIEVDIFKVTDGELEALYPLTPEDDAYAKPEYPRYNNTYWDGADASGGTGTGDVGADAEPETGDSLADATEELAADGGDDSDGGDDTGNSDESFGYDDLTDDAQQFVDDAVAAMSNADMDSITELDDFDERVATYDGTVNVENDVLAGIIDVEAL